MSGPKISMPAAVSQIFVVVDGSSQSLTPEWAAFLSSLQQVASAVSQNGSTSARPTSTTVGRFEGMPFLDRTLGFPVFLKYASSNVWVDAQGNVV